MLGSTDAGDEASAMLGAHPAETEVDESLAYLHAAELLADVAADELHRPRHRHKLPVLRLRRLAEIESHQLMLQMGSLKGSVVLLLQFNLLVGKPVAESIPIEGVSLGG